MNVENYFISLFDNKHIGNDGAFIDGFVYSKDAFFEDVHFKSSWMSYYQVAKKAMHVNISDAIAMNAKPKYALLSVAMPTAITKRQMKALSCGFKKVAKDFNIAIIGGDTISNTKLDITITIISETKKPLLRSSAKNGDLFAYTGSLGTSAKNLKTLLNGGSLHVNSKFVNITLRDKFLYKVSRYLSAGMDISDGLFSDLEKISKASRIGYTFLNKIPKSIGCSGEEYEMLISFNKRDKKTIKRLAQVTRTPLHIFAVATRVKYTNRCKSHHFKR
ncbi:thiamine-phosphate kinase [Sulfurimonas sp. SAG-AH-194-I05]|nr:thiamine-phosphate kinase [Sulfurimonas sp. SAG-AH-194-I05]MDF1875093.1 thiamine-phosphate kinase [Sulfurimonas sp. SAG-AH-194-I05]